MVAPTTLVGVSFPDDLPYDWERWLDEPLPVSIQFGAILTGGSSRFATLTSIARHLGLPTEPLGREGMYVLNRLVRPIEALIGEDPGHWTTDYLANRGSETVEAALGDITSLDAIHGALEQFGWGDRVIGRQPKVRFLVGDLRKLLIDQLARNVYAMLDVWRERDLWSRADAAMPKGLIRASTPAARRTDQPPAVG